MRLVIESSPYKGWVKYIEEDQLLGTAGIIRVACSEIRDRRLWLFHAYDLSAANWYEFHEPYLGKCKAGKMLMHTFETNHPQSCGAVCLDEQNRVTEFHQKIEPPPSNLANGAVYLLFS